MARRAFQSGRSDGNGAASLVTLVAPLVRPPTSRLTGRMTPLMLLAMSEETKTIAAACSSASATRA